MRERIIFLLLFTCLLSCQSGDKRPAGIIPEPKMKRVLWDMLRADQFLTDFVFSQDTSLNRMNESVKLYRHIFSTHQVTREQFRESFTYYREHPGLLKPLLDSVAAAIPSGSVTDPAQTPSPPPAASLPPQSTPDSSQPKPFKKIRDLKAE